MNQVPTILLADDSEDDVLFIKRAFAMSSVPNKVAVVTHGDDAIDYLHGEGIYSDRKKHPFPRLFVLDLKMPGKDGFQVLHQLRQEPALRALPIIILTGSTSPTEINRAYELGANSVLIKPLHIEKLVELVNNLTRYWLSNSIACATPPSLQRPLPC